LSVKIRLYFAWSLLIGSLIGWPLSAFVWAKDEPQFVLGLSWMAITLTALDILSTTDARKQLEDSDDA
jgi:hypothetical protein